MLQSELPNLCHTEADWYGSVRGSSSQHPHPSPIQSRHVDLGVLGGPVALECLDKV